VSAQTETARLIRWPWIALGLGIVFASAGLVLVSLNGRALTGEVTNFVAFMGMGVVGALSVSRAPGNWIGLMLLWVAISIGLAFALTELATYLYERGEVEPALWVGWPAGTLWTLGLFPLLVLLPLLFPDGRLLSQRWRPVLWIGLGVCAIAFLAVGFVAPTQMITTGGREVEVRNPLAVSWFEPIGPLVWILWPVLLLLFVVSVASMVVRFRRSRGVERQQLKWFAFAATLLAGYFVVAAILESVGISEGTFGQIVSGLVFAGIPVAVGIAILQYRLWDLDVVVKKTVVAGTLVLLAIAAYAGAVALIGALAIDQDRPALLFAIALGLGIAFRPAMRMGRRIADRIVYGRRATPYEVLTEFSERVGESYATEDVLPRMAQVLGEGTGAEVARVWLLVGSEYRPASAWPSDAPPAAPFPVGKEAFAVPGENAVEVRDRGDVLGALSVRMPATDPMSPSKEKLVRDLAAQAGLVLRNVRLVEDLRASRQRLVAAQDEERRRLERNIHDGAQQQLVALTVKARLARQLLERDPAKATDVLGQIETETQDALEDLRDLARGIYPPLLADEGLVSAIRAQARKAAIDVAVEAEGVGRYPEDVEATVYFCTLEALQNVAKYADAGQATVRLSQSNGSLSFAVVDRGRGFDPERVRSGSGLQGMADRLAAVGGALVVSSAAGDGTTVVGEVPLTG
jgi:signal transduction histidine kinase